MLVESATLFSATLSSARCVFSYTPTYFLEASLSSIPSLSRVLEGVV